MIKKTENPNWMNIHQFSKISGVAVPTLSRRCRDKKIRCVKIKNTWHICVNDGERYLQAVLGHRNICWSVEESRYVDLEKQPEKKEKFVEVSPAPVSSAILPEAEVKNDTLDIRGVPKAEADRLYKVEQAYKIRQSNLIASGDLVPLAEINDSIETIFSECWDVHREIIDKLAKEYGLNYQQITEIQEAFNDSLEKAINQISLKVEYSVTSSDTIQDSKEA